MRRLMCECGIEDHCTLQGSVSDIPALLAELDVAVLLSRSEGSSNALLEYMAAGRPIVATAVGGNVELIEHGVHGLLVPPEDPRSAADAVCRLLADRRLAADLAAAARLRVPGAILLRRHVPPIRGLLPANTEVHRVIWLLGGYMWLFVHRPFEVWPILGTLQVECASMALILLGWVLSSGFRWARNPLHAAFLALAIAMLLGWQASGRPDLGEKPVSDWFKVALFYVIVVTTVRDERDLKRLATMYVAAVAAYMAHSLWEYRNGRYQWTMGTVRLLGIDLTMGDPNTFAATILYSLPVALALWPQARKAWQHALLAGYGLLSLACILLTSSRSAFVGVCFLGVVVAVASKHRLTLVLLMAACAPLAWRRCRWTGRCGS